jgi:peptide deformylase
LTVLPVLGVPDVRLRTPARPVERVGDPEVRAAIDDLLETMRASPACVGLAATQVGIDLRIAVVDVTGHRKARSCHGELVLVNPTLEASAGGGELAREGCMSVPHLTGDVVRPAWVRVSALDASGAALSIEADAFEARALLHEIDHLDGKVFLDRVASRGAVFRRRVYR